ncbi:unnamed protein product [Adineta ricciae]|uniref:Uncharacterized protein n=1 Tax=Adineta ricciae TaxID=249248 RepID=A0A813PTW4_ADIRI|nr:unnamed protein product [Adineta ricciae]CAF1222911.1 unnamed protein product [Adineta ricciae]
MVDRDGKKPFVIPKTHTSNQDVLLSEKSDSRNVKELFHEIKSCALETHFDFRENECQSCDMIRNSKLQKLFNERKIRMKKSQDQIERYAFHLVLTRDMATKIATDGILCGELTFSIDKYLGNPKDGIHLSRRPDILLASTNSQNLRKFGLLICKILLGKGYPTVPATANKDLSAQLHHDHHFCKIQTLNKEQRNIDDLLASSLVFCYEHNDMEPMTRPSQVLPLAILWYDLTEKFSCELVPALKQPQQRHIKPLQQVNSYRMKRTVELISKPVVPLKTDIQNEPSVTSSIIKTNETTPTKYSNESMISYSSLYTSFSTTRTTTTPVEIVPLSPLEKSTSSKQRLAEKIIPLTPANPSIDPRLKSLKQTHDVFYLENTAVKRALQQQKRLNNYCDTRNELLTKRTSYTLIPYVVQPMCINEYERQRENSLTKDDFSLHVSVVDCFQLGLKRSDTQSHIDLEDTTNQFAYEQIQMSNRLIEHEKYLNSQERRLNLRERRQRKFQEYLNERKKYELPNSRICINNGRKLLKERQVISSSNTHLSSDLLDFLCNEYRQETRPQVKRILEELSGILMEKYGLDDPKSNQTASGQQVNTQSNSDIVNNDNDISLTQALNDYDERFPSEKPVPIESLDNRANISSSSADINESSTQENSQTELLPAEVNLPIKDPSFQQIEATANDIPPMIDSNSTFDQSREEFVNLLTKEASLSKSLSPSYRHSMDDDMEIDTNNFQPSTRTVTLVSNNNDDKLFIETTNTNGDEEQQQPIVKRIKVDLVPISNEDINPRRVITCDSYETNLSFSRSRSKSNSSRGSSIQDSRTNSPSSIINRNSSNRNDYQRRNRSYDRSFHYNQRKCNPTTMSLGHQRFNYNHQSAADHPRFANSVDKIPSLLDINEHDLIRIANNPSITNFNQNLAPSYYDTPPSNQLFYQDTIVPPPPPPPPPPLMSTVPLFPNAYEQSDTIERLQTLLQYRESMIQQDLPFSSSTFVNNSQPGRNLPQWSSSQFSSNTTLQNNQTFPHTDAEHLLALIKRFS